MTDGSPAGGAARTRADTSRSGSSCSTYDQLSSHRGVRDTVHYRPSAQAPMNTSGSMRILGTGDTPEWMSVLHRSRQHDFHHLPQYHRVAESLGEGTAAFFVYSEDDHLIGLPLLLRPADPLGDSPWYDATSVYGYAGPVTSGDSIPS